MLNNLIKPVFELKKLVNQEYSKNQKELGKLLNCEATITVNNYSEIPLCSTEDIKEILQVSSVNFVFDKDASETKVSLEKLSDPICPRCWQSHQFSENYDGLCNRCEAAILEFYPNHWSVKGIKENHKKRFLTV